MKRVLRVVPLLALVVTAACPVDVKSGGSCSGPKTYVAGSTITGATGNDNCRGPDGSNGQLYNMTLSQQTNVQLTLSANGFPGFLGLYTASGQPIAQRNTATSVKAFLPAGSYQVFVSSMTDADGTFTLASPNTEISGCTGTLVDGGVTTKGAVISGTLNAADCGNSLSKGDSYDLYLGAGQAVAIGITVDRLSGLFVMGNGGVLANREMTAAGSWSTTVTATTAGYYGVRIESRTANGSANLPVTYSITLN